MSLLWDARLKWLILIHFCNFMFAFQHMEGSQTFRQRWCTFQCIHSPLPFQPYRPTGRNELSNENPHYLPFVVFIYFDIPGCNNVHIQIKNVKVHVRNPWVEGLEYFRNISFIYVYAGFQPGVSIWGCFCKMCMHLENIGFLPVLWGSYWGDI